MAGYYDEAADFIRRLIRPARRTDDVVDAAGGVDDLLRNAPPPRLQVELPVAPARSPSFEGIEAAPPSPVDISLDSPNWGPLSKSADRFQQMRRGQSANLRNQPLNAVAGQAIRDADDARRAQIAAANNMGDAAKAGTAAGAAAAGAAGVGALSNAMKKGSVATAPAPAGVTSTDGTAELVNESRPAPQVEPDADAEQAFTEKFKRQYTAREQKREAKGQGGYANKEPLQTAPAKADPREQAHAMIADLNERRRKAWREVPEAPQMMAQINKLLAQADQQTNARAPQQAQAYASSNQSDPHAQASALIAQLNEMRRRAGGEVPQAPQIMAEVRRLQALGDQNRNARR